MLTLFELAYACRKDGPDGDEIMSMEDCGIESVCLDASTDPSLSAVTYQVGKMCDRFHLAIKCDHRHENEQKLITDYPHLASTAVVSSRVHRQVEVSAVAIRAEGKRTTALSVVAERHLLSKSYRV